MRDLDFSYEVLVAPLHEPRTQNRLVDGVGSKLAQLGGVGRAPDRDIDKPFAVVVGTGGTERAILDRWRRRQKVRPGEPALLIAHRTDNSLAASLEALAAIRSSGGTGRIVMLERLDDVGVAIRQHRAAIALGRSRLGVIGPPSDWLVGSTPTPEVVEARWGVSVIPLVLPTTLGEPTNESVRIAGRWSARDNDRGVAVEEIERAAGLHGPLAELIELHQLDAVTVRCFDLLTTMRTSGCLALAEFNGAGIVAGCEGDVPSVLAMMLVRHLFGGASWMANPSWIDPDTGQIDLAHCTVSPTLVADFELDSHFESGIGVGIAGRFRPQPVTLLRVGGSDLDVMWVAEGEVVGAPRSAHSCRTQARVLTDGADLEVLMSQPLGNHLVMMPGHRRAELERWIADFVRGRQVSK